MFICLNWPEIKNLDRFFIEPIEPVDFTWLLGDSPSFVEVPFLLAFNAAMQGGFTELKDGRVKTWNLDGSGSKAVNAWMQMLKCCGTLSQLTDDLLNTVSGQPFEEIRRSIIKEFLDEKNRRLLYLISTPGSIANTIEFTFHDCDLLAAAFPVAFGEDPFRKKLNLYFAMLSEFYIGRGFDVINNFPIPVDYQMPRIFEYAGILQLPESFLNEVRNSKVFDQEDLDILMVRRESQYIGEALAIRHSLPQYVVDRVLFTRVRKDPDFLRNSHPPMIVNTMWF
jgi:hypothetical protein